MIYVLDTNVLLAAKNAYYSFKLCPAFWDWLVLQRKNNNVISIEAVKAELIDSDIKRWVRANPSFFDANNDAKLNEVADWVCGQDRFEKTSIKAFLSKADPRLISYAKANGFTLVTNERSQEYAKKVKIPDVCKALGVPCVGPFEMLDNLNARFILDRS